MIEELHVKKYNARLQNFPIMMFAVVMGLSGLSLVFLKASHIFGLPKFLAYVLILVDVAVFFVTSYLYGSKIFKYIDEVKLEFSHPIRANFFAAFSISLLLLSTIFAELHFAIAPYFWYVGVSFQAFMTFYCISFWINNNIDIKHSNPAWLIPVVGNVIVPLGGVGVASLHVLYYFFAVGIFFWIVFMPILINRIIFHHQLAQKFLPTLFILIAPPAVGMVSYIKMGHGFDIFAQSLYNIALFFSLLLVFMVKNFFNLKFFISWWAFTFPLAAMSIASMVAYQKSGLMFYKVFALGSVVITTTVVALVAYKTILHVGKKEICVAE